MPCAGNRREVVGPVPAGQDAGVDRRVEGLDPAVHHLGEPGHVRDVDDRQPGGGEGLGGPAGGDQLDPQGGQAAAEVDEPGLIGNTQNCTHIFTILLTRPDASATISAALGGPAS